jgi:hypothetical protein
VGIAISSELTSLEALRFGSPESAKNRVAPTIPTFVVLAPFGGKVNFDWQPAFGAKIYCILS